MGHDLPFRTALAAGLGLIAAAGNLIGGYFVVRRDWPRKFLQYFLALGAGYMLAVAFVEVIPESVRLSGESALLYVLIGYFLVHLFEHTLAPHFHFGEETHCEEVSHQHARTSVLVGMTIHTFFDGVAIAAGFLVSTWLGAVMFVAVFSAQAAGRIHGGFGGVGERPRKAQRDPGGGTVRSGDDFRRVADKFAAGAIEVCAAAFRRRDAVRGGDGFASGSEPRAELANGAAGFRRRC